MNKGSRYLRVILGWSLALSIICSSSFPLSAQDTVVEHFKVLLRSYLNVLGDIGIDNSLDYDDVNCILKEKDCCPYEYYSNP